MELRARSFIAALNSMFLDDENWVVSVVEQQYIARFLSLAIQPPRRFPHCSSTRRWSSIMSTARGIRSVAV